MLTPTGITASAYWDAIKAGNPQHVRITFTDQNIVFTEEDIAIDGGIVITDIINSETNLVFGDAVSKQVVMSIINSSKLTDLIWTGEFTLEFGVDIGTPAVTNWVTVGIFSGDRPKNISWKSVVEFTAYDRMRKFDVLVDKFIDTLTYPITVKGIYDALCTYVGVSNVAGEYQSIMNRSYNAFPSDIDGHTCRDLLKWIAEANTSYARITPDGKVKLVWFQDNTSTYTLTEDYEFSAEAGDLNSGITWDTADTYTWDEIEQFSWDDLEGYEAFLIDQLTIAVNDFTVEYPSASGGNVYTIVDNPFLNLSDAALITAYAKPIYDRITAFGGYFPATIDCVGNWLVETGDVISVTIRGNVIRMPIFARTLQWNGYANDVYESTGENEYSPYTTESNKEKILNNNLIRLYVSDKYYQIQSGIEIKPEGIEISGSKYVKILSGGIFDVEGATVDIKSGSTFNVDSTNLKIQSGGVFYVDATNFKVDSNNRYLRCGNWEFNDNGTVFGYTNGQFRIGTKDETKEDNTGIVFLHNGSLYDLEMYGSYKYSGGIITNSIHHRFTTFFPGIGEPSVEATIIPDTEDSSLGWGDKYWGYAYIKNIYYRNINQTSSREVKHDIEKIDSFGTQIDKLIPVKFIYNDDKEERIHYGLIWEDTVGIIPNICIENDPNDPNTKAINYIELVPVLLKEIQSLRSRVLELEQR